MLLSSMCEWTNRFSRHGGRPRPRARPEKRRSQPLLVERLEDRWAPVVGANAWPAAVAAGTGYDGVVKVLYTDPSGNPYLCSGSLLTTGRHVLTAAHCVDSAAPFLSVDPGTYAVVFDMPGSSPGATQQITIPIPAANIAIKSGWTGGSRAGNDIALITLPTLAPSGPTGGTGAERYDIYRAGDEIGQTFQIVGYG